jgi:hypothetical protein
MYIHAILDDLRVIGGKEVDPEVVGRVLVDPIVEAPPMEASFDLRFFLGVLFAFFFAADFILCSL